MAFDMKDYVEVADRIKAWYKAHPAGRITTDIVEFSEARATVRAEVYRDGADTFAAGVGHSFLAVPGSTPYTRGSELENAETSAVGRALVFAGIPSKNVASAGEVRNKQANRPAANPSSQQGGGSPTGPSAGGAPRGEAGGESRMGKAAQTPKPPRATDDNAWAGMPGFTDA